MKNIGLIGWGFIGKTHFDAYQQIENANVVAICTRNEVQSIPKGIFLSTYEEVLNNPDIELIDICLPTFLHEEFIIKAAQAGKDIICEKPLSLSIESVESIMNEVERNDVNLFVAHVLRFWPEYKTIKSYYDTGKIANIDVIHAGRLGQTPQWSHWFKDPLKSGGALYDLHIHDIDFISYLLGEVEEVYAVGTKNSHGAWDHIMTTLTLTNGVKAFVEASQRTPETYPFTMSFRAQAFDHTIDFHLSAGANIEKISQSSMIYYTKDSKSTIVIPQENAFQNELSYFINCLENNEANTVIPLKDVLYTLKLMKAIETSLEKGHQIRM
ncbi:Gfo/Idh/MocA family oxidoreductase [Robertmurraya massiliosenegalensis]|uniref:Gfo/Idh/MocA family protein n=1 Tax=Robertmurraya TaxID=2837507 RepID=UPI0039A579B3